MIFKPSHLSLGFCALLLTAASAAAACPARLAADFDRAVASTDVAAAEGAMNAISGNFACNEKIDDFRGKMIDFEIDLATNPSIPAPERAKALKAANENIGIGGTWREAKKLGDYYWLAKDNADALTWYEKSISLLGLVPSSAPSSGANDRDFLELGQRAIAAKSLANNDGEGKRELAFVASRATIDGRLDGIYSPLLRAMEVQTVPLPVNFFTGETRFTPAGSAAVDELARAVKEQDVHEFKLVGHADPRGNARDNMELSRRRAEAVQMELQKRGIQARITIEAKGDTQPYDVSLIGRAVSQDEKWQLDRRVDWIPAGEAK